MKIAGYLFVGSIVGGFALVVAGIVATVIMALVSLGAP